MNPTDPKWKTAATTWKAEEDRFTKLLWSLLRGKLADVVKEMQPGVSRLLYNRGELLGMDLKPGHTYDKLASSLLSELLLMGPLDADFVQAAVRDFGFPVVQKNNNQLLPKALEKINSLVGLWVNQHFKFVDSFTVDSGLYYDSFVVTVALAEMDSRTRWGMVEDLEKFLREKLTQWASQQGINMEPDVYAEPSTLRNKDSIGVSIRF